MCLNHLNVADAVMRFSNSISKKTLKVEKDFADNGENEKSSKNKEKAEEDEKFCAFHHGQFSHDAALINSSNFFTYNVTLNIPSLYRG